MSFQNPDFISYVDQHLWKMYWYSMQLQLKGYFQVSERMEMNHEHSPDDCNPSVLKSIALCEEQTDISVTNLLVNFSRELLSALSEKMSEFKTSNRVSELKNQIPEWITQTGLWTWSNDSFKKYE